MPLAAILGCFFLLGSPGWNPQVHAVAVSTTLPALQSEQETQPGPEKPQEAAPEQAPPAQTEVSPAAASPSGMPGETPAPAPQNSPAPPKAKAKPKSGVKSSQTKTAKKPALRKKKSAPSTSTAAPAPAGDNPPKVVVNNGSTSDPKVQIAPTVSDDQAARDRQNTNQLLALVESNLNKLSEKQLNSGQQDMVKQIRQYVDQSKAADKTGDLQRAQNLASKARMLTDELLKP